MKVTIKAVEQIAVNQTMNAIVTRQESRLRKNWDSSAKPKAYNEISVLGHFEIMSKHFLTETCNI